MAAQPGIDRALSGVSLEGHFSGRTNVSDEPYITIENLDQQSFTSLHLIVLGLVHVDLEPTLRYHRLNVDTQDSNGRTPLLWAAWRGDTDTVNLLLNHGADIDKADNEGYTPLSKACEGGHLVVTQRLLKAGASVQSRTWWDDLPIHLASRNMNHGHQIVEALLKHNADPAVVSSGSGTPLHNACNRGSLQTVKTLLAAGADIDALGENSDTPSMEALYCWNEAAFLHLAREGAKLDVVNGSGHNILLVATWSASTVAWDLIIEYADRGTLGLFDVNVLHNGHDIYHCFDRCRDLWFVGQRARKEVEKAVFDRMIQACSR
jgi:ankyrin repeat protein